MKNIKVMFFIAAPLLIALTCIVVRLDTNSSLLNPDFKVRSWQIEAHARVVGNGRSGKIEIGLPVLDDRYEIESEHFVSNGFAVAIISDENKRQAVWSGVAKKSQDYDFYYRAQIQLRKTPVPSSPEPKTVKASLSPELASDVGAIISLLQQENLSRTDLIEDLIREVLKGNSRPAKSLRKSAKSSNAKAKLLVQILRLENVSARVVHGIKLSNPDRTTHFFPWIEFYHEGRWYPVSLKTSRMRIPRSWFSWRRNSAKSFQTRGLSDAEYTVSVAPLEAHTLSARRATTTSNHFLLTLSEYPVEAQALFRILLVIPVGALVVAFLRCVVGVKTMGTFMPVLVALSFRETELLWGLLLYVAVILFSLVARYCFEHLQLLVVPRLTATLTLVVLVVLAFTAAMEAFDINKGLSVALFPIVILTMMIERISIMLEELGPLKAGIQTALSLAVSAFVYLVITNKHIEYYMFTFPELLLVVLSFAVLLGRFTGYRLTELYRFRSFLRSAE